MTKHLLAIFIIFIMVTVHLVSAPIKNYPVQLSQPDGSVIECYVSGDEFFNYYHTSEGYFIKQGNDGYYYLADQTDGKIVTTLFRADRINPAGLKIEKWLQPDEESIKYRKEFQSNYDKFSKSKDDVNLLAREGKLNNIVIFIKFLKDTEYNDKFSDYDDLYNHPGQVSFKNYYMAASYDRLDVTTHFYPPQSETIVSYTDIRSRNFYSPYSEIGNPDGYDGYEQRKNRENYLLERALEYAIADIPKDIDFDSNDDGYVDNVTFILKGTPTGWSTLLWPHRSWMFNSKTTINGAKVLDYNVGISELTFDNNYGLGTIVHEFFHTLGAPDLYHYNYDGFRPTGVWDLMSETSNPPQFMCNYLKYQYTGWVDKIPTIIKEGTYKLYPTTHSDSNIYKINIDNSEDFLILEYRKKTATYDSRIPGNGLLVYYINNERAYQGNAQGPPDEIYLLRPDGSSVIDGNIGAAHFTKDFDRTSIGAFTNPSLSLNSPKNVNIEIYNIGSPGETITFQIGYTQRTVIKSPANKSYDNSLLPIIKWAKVPAAFNYDVEVSDDINFRNIIAKGVELLDTSYTLKTELLKGKAYFARVKWRNSSKLSPWSDVCEFHTIPDKTVLVSPSDNQEKTSILPTLVWMHNLNNNYYRVQIAEDESFTKIVTGKTFITDSLFRLTKTLELGKKYYWQVRSFSKGSYITDSDIYSFETNDSEILILNSSKSTDLCEDSKIELFVNAVGSIKSYSWFYNDTPIENAKNPKLTLDSFNTEIAGKYYCIIENFNPQLTTQTPDINLAVIRINSAKPVENSIQSGINKDILINVLFSEQHFDISKSFSFRWFRNNQLLLDNDKYKGTATQTLRIINSEESDSDEKYVCRISSICGDTIYTSPISVLVSVKSFEFDNASLKLYPNPSENVINIQYDNFSRYSDNTIRIFNYMGVEVFRQIINDYQNNESALITIDLSHFSAGMYIIKTGNYTSKFIKK